MRWKFADLNKPEEKQQHDDMLKRIDAWWAAFNEARGDIEAYLEDRKEWNLEAWVDKHLQPIDQNIMWEFGGDEQGNFQLVITPEDERHLRPLVQTILDRAPKLPKWRFYQYRHPQPLTDANEVIADETGIDLTKLRALVTPGEGNFVNLLYTTPEFERAGEQNVVHAGFLATEHLLGEEVLDRWIGMIDAAPESDSRFQAVGDHRIVTMVNLANETLRIINAIRSELPNQPYFTFKDSLGHTTFELEPEESDDYPHQLDMVFASSNLPEMWKAAHAGLTFDSARFSRVGEHFCYLKMDGKDSYANSPQSRDRLAKTLDEKLRAEMLGCVIGGAGGLRYSYIDLALHHVEKAIPVIKAAMDYERMPERSWLLFFDADWSQEWVGMFENSPAPLLPETEKEVVL